MNTIECNIAKTILKLYVFLDRFPMSEEVCYELGIDLEKFKKKYLFYYQLLEKENVQESKDL